MPALLARIPIARNTLDNVDHGPIMNAFRNETDATHYRPYGVSFIGDHYYDRPYIETRGFIGSLICHGIAHPTRSCSRETRYVQCTSAEHILIKHPKHECKEGRKAAQRPKAHENQATRAARCG